MTITTGISRSWESPLTAQPSSWVGMAHGTLGELWQGPFRGNLAIISLPTSAFSRATFVPKPGGAGSGPSTFDELPPLRTRVLEIFRELYPYAIIPAGSWELDGNLAVGQGMASSTADIVSLLRCLSAITNVDLNNDDIQRILMRLERSDPVFLDHITLYETGRQRVVQEFPSPLVFDACYVIESKPIPTAALTEADLLDVYNRRLDRYESSLDMLIRGLETDDPRLVARASTTSAVLAQHYLPSPLISLLVSDYRRLGAWGIARAHTGSVVALLFARTLKYGHKQTLSQYFRSLGHKCFFERVGSVV